MTRHPIVSRKEWLEARKRHLENEKKMTRMRDRLAAERRALPWVKVEKQYVFSTTGGHPLRHPPQFYLSELSEVGLDLKITLGNSMALFEPEL